MSDQQSKSIRFTFVFLCLIALFGVIVIAPVSPKVGAKSVRKVTRSLSPPSEWLRPEKIFATPIGQSAQSQQRFSHTRNFQQQERESSDAVLKDGLSPGLDLSDRMTSMRNQTPAQKKAQSPESVTNSLCLGGNIIVGTHTYVRPANCQNVAFPGAGYNAFGFNLTGCGTTATINMQTCTANGCPGQPGATTIMDTVIAFYRNASGTANPFDQGFPSTNYTAANCNDDSCGTLSNLSVASVANGHFVVVVSGFDPPTLSASRGTFQIFVSTTCGTIAYEPTAADGTISGTITASDGAPVAGAVVNLTGSQSRKTITDGNGSYHFDRVETTGFYTVTPSRANYGFSPAERSFSQLGNNTEATFTATSNGDSANPLDTPEYFVRQHYLDFLGREPDESGFNFWSDQILGCGTDMSCIERRRENVSAAYFLSIEFQQTGGLVDGLYRASYGVRPQFADFMPDTATIARDVVVGRSGWEQLLNSNKQAFLDAWVKKPEFRAAYDLLTNDGYVDALIAHTGVSFTPSERDALVNGLTFGAITRSGVLQRIAEDERFVAAKRNEAFVMMEYFGYLRRDPDATGFAFWLNKLNQFNGNFEQAEMVKAFIVSGEYRDRFPQ